MNIIALYQLYFGIFYGKLNPWAKDQNTPMRYEELLHEMKEESYHVQPFFEVDFPKSIQPIRIFYTTVIQNEAICFLNTLNRAMDVAIDGANREYIMGVAFDTIEEKLKITDNLIKEKGLNIEKILCSEDIQTTYAELADAAYILRFLKSELIRLYLEVQQRYKKYPDRTEMSKENLHHTYFGEEAPAYSTIIEVPQILLPKQQDDRSLSPEEFQPLLRDTRPPVENVLRYDDIIADKQKFARLEIELYDNKLINKGYLFQRKPQGNVKKMAAVYRVSKSKGYYRQFYFKDKRQVRITEKDVQTFLNYRYTADINKEFRRFANKQLLEAFVKDLIWISHMDRF